MSDLPQKSQLVIYQAEDGSIKIDVRFEDETVWLTQQHTAELFQTTRQNISLHLRNIYDEGELAPKATHKEFLSVRREGGRDVQRSLDFYNLVEQYLVFAEGQAMRRIPMRMGDWIAKLDGFLRLNERGILTDAGKIAHELAISHAEQEYEAFHRQRLAENAARPDDFEKSIKALPLSKPRKKKKKAPR